MLGSLVRNNYGDNPLKEIKMFLIKEGNYFNVPVKVYYIEDSTDTSVLPDNAPVGSIAIANDSTNGFAILMKDSNDSWNEVTGATLCVCI